MACYEYKGVKYTEEDLVKLLQSQQLKTRRILELQSDLFQKGRDKEDLITPKGSSAWNDGDKERSVQITKEEFYQLGKIENKGGSHLLVAIDKNGVRVGDANTSIGGIGRYWKYEKITEDNIKNPTNQFLQLLNKDNNWVTFFVKSIIQDTAKQTITEVQESDVEAKVRELEKEGLLEIDCKGKIKAEKGLQTNFTKGGKWKLIKDLKGYPTHKEGGVDLTIGKNGVSIKNGNTEFTAKHGLVIPKN